MYLGKICEVAASDELYASPAHHYTAVLLSSIPVPDPERRGHQRTAIEGEPPSPVLPPPGCRFHTRCPAAQDICRSEEPQLRADGRRATSWPATSPPSPRWSSAAADPIVP